MTTVHCQPHRDVEPLCEDFPIGRFGVTGFVSLDISLAHRDTEHWGGQVFWRPDPRGPRLRFTGPFRELYVQHRVRRYLPFASPRSFDVGCPISTWQRDPRWRTSPRVLMADLHRLEQLVDQYQSRLRAVTDSDGQPIPGVNEIEFIPTETEDEIRSIALRISWWRKRR